MPKEQINTAVRQLVQEGDDGEVFLRGMRDGDEFPTDPHKMHVELTPVLYVSWPSQESAVHDVALDADGRAAYTMEVSEEAVLRAAEQIKHRRVQAKEWPERDQHIWHDGMVGFTTLLVTRAEHNKLIKTVRRARDAVYGSDE